MPRRQLPVVPAPPTPLRADAARNRAKVLAAADELFRTRGVDAVTLDDVVAAAGVGKGTLYRTFGDKSGLATALLDDAERDLQEQILHGRAPLGPGVAADRRAAAFVRAYVHFVADYLDLVLMSQTARSGARFDTGSHQFWRAHLAYLATQAGVRSPALVADVVLSALTAEQLAAWLRRDERSADQLGNQLATLTSALFVAR